MRNISSVLLVMLFLSSCVQDDYSRIMEDESNETVLSAKSDSTGITGGGTDFGFDDDGEPPATSIHNPTVD